MRDEPLARRAAGRHEGRVLAIVFSFGTVAVLVLPGCGEVTAMSADDGGALVDAHAEREAGAASGTDATADSTGDAMVADRVVDASSGEETSDSELPPSCAPGGPGMTNCGSDGGESCCTSLEVPGGTYDRTYTSETDGGPTGEGDPATVSSFRLDEYLVTVGRFRQFVAAWNKGSGYYPPANSGKHTHLNGNFGLVDSAATVDGGVAYESGWNATDWNNTTYIDPTDSNLTHGTVSSCVESSTWTSSAGSQENLPIDCMNWYEAYAFCIWDSAFLPSEAEWEYAAAAGNQQREYPWGSTGPGTANLYAIYGNYYTGNSLGPAPVGYASLGAGYWGQLDLAGELWEWNLDWYTPTYVDPCTDCAYVPSSPTTGRALRGGDYFGDATILPPSSRTNGYPLYRSSVAGIRCARTP
jgi:formylglycine-generating enzyme required for sulfatase activity